MNRCRSILILTCLIGAAASCGCGKATATVNDAPFRAAIADYLRDNNMALKVKNIKEGPVVEGEQASLSASLTHEQLGGPSVTWKFVTIQPSKLMLLEVAEVFQFSHRLRGRRRWW